MSFLKQLLKDFALATIVIFIFHYSFDSRLVFKTIVLDSIYTGIGVSLGIASLKLMKKNYSKQRA
ncbi:hypothetical protein [Mucilaginibacter polytrichastri]|uniref:Uncharacterized protein n=1 Tax=Mucilaginibacter polytrichastri TaxID=1302689 RepID=A0A1Q6A2V8_9SPHI|nr:hypothetical protein [Mucilaginibacter polytrichastri]OKS88346.1 hypothetical protein RG47T_3812 [Mucilaginibacter polytrichastri]SFT13944.1 hypothetical protein SAMN04487890_11283 [Mucilaginibacter polytrichastri]